MASTVSLREHLLTAGKPLFAVVDGAQFDNLPSRLFDDDLAHRALYLDRGVGGRDRSLTTPQLVWLDRDAAFPQSAGIRSLPADPSLIDRLLSLLEQQPAAVFWECPAGGDALYRHLRTINMVMIPRGAALGNRPPPGAAAAAEGGTSSPDGETHEMVLFRHADANVMAQVLPALDRAQFARLFGPATSLSFAPDSEWTSGSDVMVAPRPDALPAPRPGPLRLEDRNIAAIEGARSRALKRQALSEFGVTGGRGSAEMPTQVSDAFDRAEAYGLRTKDQIWTFIKLDVENGARFERNRKYASVLEHLKDDQLNSDAKLFCASAEANSIRARLQP